MPTWILLLVWLFGAAATLTGRLSGEIAISGLLSGLVLIMLIIGFTVTQFAFRVERARVTATVHRIASSALTAIEMASVGVWEWKARRDEIKLDPVIEATLGLKPGELSIKVDDLLGYLHQADRERVLLLSRGPQGRVRRHGSPGLPPPSRRQHLPLVRDRRRQPFRPLTAVRSAASASSARSPTSAALRNVCCTMRCTTA